MIFSCWVYTVQESTQVSAQSPDSAALEFFKNNSSHVLESDDVPIVNVKTPEGEVLRFAICAGYTFEAKLLKPKEVPPFPQCPKCGSTNFKELQTVYEAQSVSWDQDEKVLEYGDVEFHEIECVTEIECASCNHELGADFFDPWHQGKTRSEIYGGPTAEEEPCQEKKDA